MINLIFREIIDSTKDSAKLSKSKSDQAVSKSKLSSKKESSGEKSHKSLKGTPSPPSKRRKISDNSEVSVKKTDINAKIYNLLYSDPLEESKYDDVYCIWCNKTQAGEKYIGCEKCDDWFHYECINMDPHQTIGQYTCRTCSLMLLEDL